LLESSILRLGKSELCYQGVIMISRDLDVLLSHGAAGVVVDAGRYDWKELIRVIIFADEIITAVVPHLVMSSSPQKRSKPSEEEEQEEEAPPTTISKLRVVIICIHDLSHIDKLVLDLPATVVARLDRIIHSYMDGREALLSDIIEKVADTDELAARICSDWKRLVEVGTSDELDEFWPQAQDEWLAARKLPGTELDQFAPKVLTVHPADHPGCARVWIVPFVDS
jgi:hypothetical protein